MRFSNIKLKIAAKTGAKFTHLTQFIDKNKKEAKASFLYAVKRAP